MENLYIQEEQSIFQNIAILIPAFNPDNKLALLIDELTEAGAANIIVVDDGSKAQYKGIFEKIKVSNQCIVLHHAINLGKGRALKTGFNYFLIHYKKFKGVITVDADGQHKCEDIIKVAKALNIYNDSLILGTRDINNENIPFKSRFGNLLTAKIFSFFSGVKVSDTQTGLRGIPSKQLLLMLKINGEKYEFEMNMLLECSEKRMDIKEVPIETIYIEDNKSPHFNPFIDSIKIYAVFLKFIFSSLTSFMVDILSFAILTKLFLVLVPNYFILLSTIGSRITSSAFNYIVNHKTVFRFEDKDSNSIVKYYILALAQMLLSAIGVSLIYKEFHQGEVIIKMIVDSALFFGSFRIQRDWVFKSK